MQFKLTKENKIIFYSLFLFFVLRIVVAYFIGRGTIPGDDSVEYNNYALTILKGTGWLYSSDFAGKYREPLYPIFLAAVYFIFGKENFFAVYVFQALINTLTIFIIYKLAFKIFGKKAASVAFFWSGFYGFYLYFSGQLLREVLIYFFLVLFFYFCYLWLSNTSKKDIFFASLTYFLLIHTDCRYLYLLPCILVLLIIYKHLIKGMKNFLVFMFIVIILSLPWVIRNYKAHNNFVLINSYYFKPGSNIIKGFRYAAHILKPATINITNNPDYPREEERVLIKRGQNPNNRSAAEIAAIKADIYPPSTFWGRTFSHFKQLWLPCMFSGEYTPFPFCKFIKFSFRHNVISLISYGILFPFTLIGAIMLAMRNKKAFLFFFLPIFLHTFIHTLTWGEYRFRVPIDFFLIILAAFGIVTLCNYLSKNVKVTKKF
ncbi:MAG: glycosyltransferase family 39 protein [Candidatus Omnitrophota bacterium]|nr:glycosyltransferase family 39 protein [Candidatus Omnitrophota bacterium]